MVKVELSQEARAIRNARARKYYHQNPDRQKEYNRRYWEKQATMQSETAGSLQHCEIQGVMYEWLKNHQAKPKTIGCFYSYAVVSGETGLSVDEIVSEINQIRIGLFENLIVVQTSVKSNGERGIRVISLR